MTEWGMVASPLLPPGMMDGHGKGLWERDGSDLPRQELPATVPPQKRLDDVQLLNGEFVWHTSCRGEGFQAP